MMNHRDQFPNYIFQSFNVPPSLLQNNAEQDACEETHLLPQNNDDQNVFDEHPPLPSDDQNDDQNDQPEIKAQACLNKYAHQNERRNCYFSSR